MAKRKHYFPRRSACVCVLRSGLRMPWKGPEYLAPPGGDCASDFLSTVLSRIPGWAHKLVAAAASREWRGLDAPSPSLASRMASRAALRPRSRRSGARRRPPLSMDKDFLLRSVPSRFEITRRGRRVDSVPPRAVASGCGARCVAVAGARPRASQLSICTSWSSPWATRPSLVPCALLGRPSL